MTKQGKILIYGYGNPGRQDDGLGIALCEEIERWAKDRGYAHIDVDSNYQLNIEDAYQLKQYSQVYFADASSEEIQSYLIDEVIPSSKVEFTMHAVSPGFILNLCMELYGEIPDTYLIHIKGYEWEFMEKISERAKHNLNLAVEELKTKLSENTL